MKFNVKTLVRKGPRLGELTNIENKPDIVIETPLALLHTQAGHIPHITHEVLKLVCQTSHILEIPLITMHQFKEALEQYERRIAEFIGAKDSLICLTLYDPANVSREGHHLKGKVPVFTKWGKALYDAETYMNVVESFKPDMYYLLSDSDTNKNSSQKRISKAVENTVAFNKQCLARHRASKVLKNTFVMAAIAGGFCPKSRKKCIEGIKESEAFIQGYLIDGLHNNGPEVEFQPYEEIKPIVESTLEALPPEMAVSVQGCWSPVTVLQLVNAGVDIFDTSYCLVLIERSAALTFSLDTSSKKSTECEINLRQDHYADDFVPLMDSCSCLTCKGYTRGYVHHLLTVHELLGPILIMIHNIHHTLKFFEKIRETIRNDTFHKFMDHVTQQYKNHQKETVPNVPVTQQRNVFGLNKDK